MLTIAEVRLAETDAFDLFNAEKVRIKDYLISQFSELIRQGESTIDGLLSRLSPDEQYVVRCYMQNFLTQLSDEMKIASIQGRMPDLEAIERAISIADDEEANYLKKSFFGDVDSDLIFDLAEQGSLLSDRSRDILALDDARRRGLFSLIFHYLKISRKKNSPN